MTSKRLAASNLSKLTEEPTLLLTKVEQALEDLSDMGCHDEKTPFPNYTRDRKAANLAYIRALLDEGKDPHNAILAIYGSFNAQGGLLSG